MDSTEFPELLTVQEVADYLRVPRSWVYERTRMKTMPVYKIGKHVRIPRDPFFEWLSDPNTSADHCVEDDDVQYLHCKKCGKVKPVIIQAGPHLRGDCPTCGGYIKFIKQK